LIALAGATMRSGMRRENGAEMIKSVACTPQ